ncbi:hypothetical protein [Brevirhabdus sp.]
MEKSLSFLGLGGLGGTGVQPPDTSLGIMAGFGRDWLPTAPWIRLPPRG